MLSLQAPVEDIQIDGMTQFECDLTIPETEIYLQTNKKYIPSKYFLLI